MNSGRFRRKLATRSRGQNRLSPGVICLQALLYILLPICFLQSGVTSASLAQPSPSTSEQPMLETVVCPDHELSALVTQLMLDLPSYSNRVIQRASDLGDQTPLYFMAAGQAAISPVSLEAIAQDPNRSRLPVDGEQASQQGPNEEIYEIRFTTLERQYLQRSSAPTSSSVEQTLNQAAPSFQQFHRLILARQLSESVSTEPSPWRLLNLRSQLAPYPSGDQRLTPAQASLQGPVGQGMMLWFRDWQSGAIRLSTAELNSGSAHGSGSYPPCASP